MSSCVVCSADIRDDARFCPSCGAEQPRVNTAEGDDPFLGRTIARNFKIEKLLGVGGMGKVYKARQLSLDKDVVIKVLHDHFRDDPQLVQRFQREARAASRLNHPNSIQVIDFGQDESGVLFMAIEFLNGTDLFSVLQKEGPLAAERIARIMIQVCSALGEAHEMNVIHRDLKPENIMVEDRRGRRDFVKVLDFGIAKIQDPDDKGGQALTQAGMVCGTPEYMSPEQARGQQLDARSDLYSLGVLVYQLATGDLPFVADTPIGIVTKHILEKPTPPRQKYPQLDIPEPLEAIILRAMDKEPQTRFQNAHEMQVAFENMLRTPSGAVPGFEEPSQMALLRGGTQVATPAVPGAHSHPTEDAQEAVSPLASKSVTEDAQSVVAAPAAAGPTTPTGAGTQVHMAQTGAGALAAHGGGSSMTGPRLTSPTPTGLVEADPELPKSGGAKIAAIAAVVVLLIGGGVVFAMKDSLFGDGGGDKVVENGTGDPQNGNPDGPQGPGEGPTGQVGTGGANTHPDDPTATGDKPPRGREPQGKDPQGKDPGSAATGHARTKDDDDDGAGGRRSRGRRGKTPDRTDDKVAVHDSDDDDRKVSGRPPRDGAAEHAATDDKDDDTGRSRKPPEPKRADDKPKHDDDKPKRSDDKPDRRADRAAAQKLQRAAQQAAAAGNYDKAYDLAKEAIQADPSFADSRTVIALVHKSRGAEDKACAAIRDYIKLKGVTGPRRDGLEKQYCK